MPCAPFRSLPCACSSSAFWKAATGSKGGSFVVAQAERRVRTTMERSFFIRGESSRRQSEQRFTAEGKASSAHLPVFRTCFNNGAEGGTRTPTGLLPLRPERSASTSSTTSARSTTKCNNKEKVPDCQGGFSRKKRGEQHADPSSNATDSPAAVLGSLRRSRTLHAREWAVPNKSLAHAPRRNRLRP